MQALHGNGSTVTKPHYGHHYLVLYMREGDTGIFSDDLDFIVLHPVSCRMELKYGELGDTLGRQVWLHACGFQLDQDATGADEYVKAFGDLVPNYIGIWPIERQVSPSPDLTSKIIILGRNQP